MPVLRIRLNFEGVIPGTKARKCWFLLNTSTCRVVADLEHLIQERFGLGRKRPFHVISLYLQDCLLPSQEKIDVIRDNDALSRVVKEPAIADRTFEMPSSDEESNGIQQSKQHKHKTLKKTKLIATAENDKLPRGKTKKQDSQTLAKFKKGKKTKSAKTSVVGPKTLSKQKRAENGNKTKISVIKYKPGIGKSSSNSKVGHSEPSGSDSDTSSASTSSSSTSTSSTSTTSLTPTSSTLTSSTVTTSTSTSSTSTSSSTLATSISVSSPSSSLSFTNSSNKEMNANSFVKSNDVKWQKANCITNNLDKSTSNQDFHPRNNLIPVNNSDEFLSKGHIRFESDDSEPEQMTTTNNSANQLDENCNNKYAESCNNASDNNNSSVRNSYFGKCPLKLNNSGKGFKRQNGKDNSSGNSKIVQRGETTGRHSRKSLHSHASNHLPTGCTTSQEEQCHNSNSFKQVTTATKEQDNSKRDYSLCAPLHGPPRPGDRIVFKIVEMSSSYTPEVSDYKFLYRHVSAASSAFVSVVIKLIMEGKVLGYDVSCGLVQLHLTRESLAKPRGDGNISRKFELVYDDEDDGEAEIGINEVAEQSTEVSFAWSDMIDPRLIT